jgi:hypothetical protein
MVEALSSSEALQYQKEKRPQKSTKGAKAFVTFAPLRQLFLPLFGAFSQVFRVSLFWDVLDWCSVAVDAGLSGRW